MVDMKSIIFVIGVVCCSIQYLDARDMPDGWEDPTNMFGSYDDGMNKPGNPENVQKVVSEISDCNHPLLRRFVSVFYKQLENIGDPTEHLHYEADIQLKANQWTSLKSFADTCGMDGKDITDLLESMITDVSFPKTKPRWHFLTKFDDYFHNFDVDFITMAGLFSVTVFVGVCFGHFSWFTLLKKMLLFAFILSFPWTYIHEYKIAVAEYNAKRNAIPKECENQKEQSLMAGVIANWRSMFSVSKDPCAEYHEYHLISPLLKVPPTKVIAITLTRFFVEPIEHIGTAFSKAFRNAFSDLPITLWIPAFICIIIFLVLVVILTLAFFGYSFNVSLPFWSGVQMGPQQQIQNDLQYQQMLKSNRQHIDQLNATIRELQQRRELPAIEQRPPERVSEDKSIFSFLNFGSRKSKSVQKPSPPRYQDVQQSSGLPYPDPESETDLMYESRFDRGDGVRQRSRSLRDDNQQDNKTRGASGNGCHLIGFEHLSDAKHRTLNDLDPAVVNSSTKDVKADSDSERKSKSKPEVLESLSRNDYSSEELRGEGTIEKESSHPVKAPIEKTEMKDKKFVKQVEDDSELSFVILDSFKRQAEEGISYHPEE